MPQSADEIGIEDALTAAMSSRPILLAKDDRSIGEVLKAALEMDGYEVVWALDGRAALELAALVDPVLVISDMMMPVLDGFGFMSEYKRRSARPAPVIAISALSEYVAEAKSHGAALAFRKPFDILEFLEAVGKIARFAADAPNRPVRPGQSTADALIAETTERRRLEQIARLDLDAPAPEVALHDFVAYVARKFDVPVCLLSMITPTKQYWTAMCGIEGDLKATRGGPRKEAFCSHTVSASSALIVQDASTNPVFAANPFVKVRGFRFYAGVPLILRTGEAVGTLCLLDFRPKVFTALDLSLLRAFSKRALAEFDRRDKAAHPDQPDSAFPLLTYVDKETDLVGREGFMDVVRVESCRRAQMRQRCYLTVIQVPKDEVRRLGEKLTALAPRAWIGRLSLDRVGVLLVDTEPSAIIGILRRESFEGSEAAPIDVTQFCGFENIALSILEDRLPEASTGDQSKAG